MALAVFHVLDESDPTAGALETSLGGLTRALEALGVRSVLVTSGGVALPVGDSRVERADFAWAARRMAECDVVHFHGWTGRRQRTVARLARSCRKPYVVSGLIGAAEEPPFCAGWMDGLGWRFLDRPSIEAAGTITAANEMQLKELRRSLPRGRTVLLPYGVDEGHEGEGDQGGSPNEEGRREGDQYRDCQGADVPDRDEGTDVDSSAFRILHSALAGLMPPAGRLVVSLTPMRPQDAHVDLLKAFADLGPEAEGWSIVLAGAAPEQWVKTLQAAIRRKGGAERVQIVPAANARQRRFWLLRSSVVVALDTRPREPLEALDALVLGRPLLLSESLTLPELNCAIRVCRPTRESIRESLRALIRVTDEDRAEIGRQAQKKAIEYLAWPVLAPRYVQLYQSLAQSEP
jgi:glycosyltransferase involved in cell wall biosynthesis